ncbi:MAG TPA: hypothetical protein ACFYD1_05550 [Candidatus Hypogeohydataceae bacterium YC38]|nr:hypothetical protein [Candidatus Brocadiales bacterium]
MAVFMRFLLAWLFITSLCLGAVYAQEGKEVTVYGTNYCLGCALKKTAGAKAQCSVYGHVHSLKIDKAVGADGKVIESLTGKTLHYLQNDQASPLIKGEQFHGAPVEVKGTVFEDSLTVDVDSFGEPKK